MSRLSSMDASFLRVESPNAHMHVGWLSLLDLPHGYDALPTEAVLQRIRGRLHLVPRFRQRVTPVPLAIGEPVWRDDPSFYIANHVRELPAAEPVSPSGLRAVADGFFSQPLRRDRPLWEILLVPRVGSRGAALLGKVHHAMIDGIAGVELGMLLFDVAPDALDPEPVGWSPRSEPAPLRLAADAVADSAIVQWRAARRMMGLGRSPAQTLRIADTLRRAALSLAEDALRPAPASYLNVDIGPRRTLATRRMRLSRLQAVKRQAGVTLNDVVLTVCAGALRRFAVEAELEPVDLRVMVPFNMRRSGDAAADGNRIAFGFIELPISNTHAEQRLRRVVDEMARVKADGHIEGSSMLLAAIGALPEPIKARAARLGASPRLYNLTISNVPGPAATLYVGGARVRSIYPVIPIPDRHALSIGVLTYDGSAHFTIYADPQSLPRAARLTGALEDALTELELVYIHPSPRERRHAPVRRRPRRARQPRVERR